MSNLDASNGPAPNLPDHSVAASSVAAFVTALAASTPVPAGGSAAAVSAAQGAALVAMAARITAQKAGGPADELMSAAQRLTTTSQRLLELATEDSRAFAALLAAQRAARRQETTAQQVRAAQRATMDVPLAVCRACLESLHIAATVAPQLRASVAPDAWAGAQMIATGGQISLANTRINLRLCGGAEQHPTQGDRAARCAEELRAAWAAASHAFSSRVEVDVL